MNNRNKPQPDSICRKKLQDSPKKEIASTIDIDFSFLKLLPWFDAHEIRNWFYSAKYFSRTSEIVNDIPEENQIVTMQIFQKTHWAIIAWIELVVNLIKLCAWEYKDNTKAQELFEKYIELKCQSIKAYESNKDDQLEIYKKLLEIKKQLDVLWKSAGEKISIEKCVQDWEVADQFQPILKIHWPYKLFAKLESVYLWIFARATKVATNTSKVVQAAKWKPILFFADRFDLFDTQNLDWYAALLAGAKWVATDAWGYSNNLKWIWTMPHALIASFNGSTKQATLEFAQKYHEIPCISLVDFDNNCPKTSVEVAEYLKQNWKELYWVRLDTSGSMVDEWLLFEKWLLEKMFDSLPSNWLMMNYECWELDQEISPKTLRQEYLKNKWNNNVINNSLFSDQSLIVLRKLWITWVCPELVKLVRKKLDENWFSNVKILVSWGFNAEKINLFEQQKIPVDGYWIWSSLLAPKYVKDNWDFTADIIKLNWKPVSKIWRKEFF